MGYSTNVPEPQQDRARAAARRILEATQRLLTSRDLDEVSLAEIALEADVSHGTLYARYRTKRALLHEVHEAYCAGVRAEVGSALSRLEADDGDPRRRLEDGVRIFVRHVIRNRRAVRNFWRAGSTDPKFRSRQRALDREQLGRVVACVEKHIPAAAGLAGEQAGRTVIALVRDIVDTQAPLGNDREIDIERTTAQVTALLLTLLGDQAPTSNA